MLCGQYKLSATKPHSGVPNDESVGVECADDDDGIR